MKKRTRELLFKPKTIIFTLGGCFIGFILFKTALATIIGGLLGFLISMFSK